MGIVVPARIAVVLALFALAAPPGGALAQNLLTNGGFDSTVTGWSGPIQFSPLDAAGKPSSGSILVANSSPINNGGVGALQCLALSGVRTYYASANVRIPSGQGRTGHAYVTPQWYPQAGCGGSPLGFASTSNVTVLDTWAHVSVGTTAPAAAQSLGFFLETVKDVAGGQFQVQFDDASLIGSVPATLTIPASASIHGSKGAFFHSDLWVTNRSYANAQTITARFRCYAGQSCGTGTKSFDLQPRQSALYADAVGGLFAAPETAGAIELTYDTVFGQVTAGSRVYTPSLPAPTNGSSIPALPASEARSRALFLGLGSNGGDLSSGFRSNAGAYNPSDAPVSITFTLQDGLTALPLGGPITRTWAPREAFQINDVFAAAVTGSRVTQNASLVVTASAPVFPYVTVIDNQSGDSVFVPASPDDPFTSANLLANASFDANTSGWTDLNGYPVLWSPLDADGSSHSGSVTVNDVFAGASTSGTAIQCHAVQPGRTYLFSGKVRIPSGQTGAGDAKILLHFFTSNAICDGAVATTVIGSTQSGLDAWLPVGGSGVAPAGAQAAAFRLVVTKPGAAGTFQALFDDLSLIASDPQTATVPASASIHGSNGAFFHSDLWVMNRSTTRTQTVSARLRCFATAPCPSASTTFDVSPRQTVLFADAVGTLFASPERAGAIELAYDAALGPISAGSRVYTPSLPAPTNGAAIPALAASEARTRALFIGLGANGGNLSSGFRTNAGAYNPGAASATVTFTLYNGATGVVLGSPLTRTWAANEAFQVNDVFAAAGAGASVTTNAYLVVTSSAPVFSYVTVIDNQSGDSVFVPASGDEAP